MTRIGREIAPAELIAAVLACGFQGATIDPEGYRRGGAELRPNGEPGSIAWAQGEV